jgi:hypothetical protein
MSVALSDVQDAERFLALAATAEQVAILWRQRAAAVLGVATTAPASAPPPPTPRPTRGPKRIPTDRILAMFELGKSPKGASREQLMIAAGWERLPYPSTLRLLAKRRGLDMKVLTGSGRELRYRFIETTHG